MQVGYTSFLIYLSIALFAPLIGFLNYKIKPSVLLSLGIFGYGIYSLGMIAFVENNIIFYILQIILGISASLFFVSARNFLMSAQLENPDRAFGWFYSANSYADAFAPAVGALVIWKFGFPAVFALSFFIQIANSLYCFIKLKGKNPKTENINVKQSAKNYLNVVQIIKSRSAGFYIAISFMILLLAGFNNTFFVLFLKNLGWTQNKILLFSSLLSLTFLPISFWVIKQVEKFRSEKNISRGSQILGVFVFLMGGLSHFLNFYYAFFISIGQNIGGLMSGSGRSGLMTTKLKEYPQESAAVDTVFSPLATALGSIFGGFLIGAIGYPLLFVFSGILLFSAGLAGVVKSKKLS